MIFYIWKNEDNRKHPKRKGGKVLFSQVILKIKHCFLVLSKAQEKLKIFFITIECPHYELFSSEIPHRHHHLHLPQFLVLVKKFSSHQQTLRSGDTRPLSL